MTSIFIYEYLTALGSPGGVAQGANGTPLAPLLAEGRAMFDAVAADVAAIPDVEVRTIARDDEMLFRQNAARVAFTLVIAPESAGVLEERCRWVEESNGRLLGPTSQAVQLTGDKFALFEHFAEAGIPTPRTWAKGASAIGGGARSASKGVSASYPIIWKPRYGAGSQATFLLKTADDCDRIRRELAIQLSAQRMIAQEYVDGIAASVAFLIGPRETVALTPCYQRLSRDGRFHYLGGSCPIDPGLARRAIDLAASAVRCVDGLRGYVGVDVVLGAHSSADRVIEINPRLTTSYVGLRRLARFNIAQMLLHVLCGVSLPELDWHPGPVEFLPDGSDPGRNAR